MYSFIIRGRSLKECYKGNSNETLDSIDIFTSFSQFVLTLFAVVIDSSFTLLLIHRLIIIDPFCEE